MTRRFEFSDEKSNKFWEITVKGKTVTVQYGRLGTNGQTQVKNHATPAEAKAAAEKQIAEKVKKGYQEVGGEAAAKKAPAKKTRSKQTSTPTGGVDKQQLAAIWRLLKQDDLASVQQGISLLQAMDDPAVWASLADRLSIDEDDHLSIPRGCEVDKRAPAHRELVALWALRHAGRLTGLHTLDLSGCDSLTDMAPLAGLTGLQVLNLSNCRNLVSLDGLSSCPALSELSLSGCAKLVNLNGLKGCNRLRAIELYGEGDWETGFTELDVVTDLWKKKVLPLDDWRQLPLKVDEQGCDGRSEGWAYGGMSQKSERMAREFAALREHLELPSLEVVYLEEPGEKRRDRARDIGLRWNSEARDWEGVDDDEDEDEEYDEDDEYDEDED